MDRLGKYSILGELGRGAMGIVYLGEDPYIGRKVALKTIRFENFTQPSEQEMAQQRFMREARSAGNLSHPRIITIYEVGEDRNTTFIAMEYIEGLSLEDLISSGKKFSQEEITDLLAQIGDALDYAHQRGVIHRDIKPANILIDKEGHPHIVDFGIARFTSSTMTLTRAIIGTPHYMSPEQISGKEIDHRTDIFSLGTILYELLTGNKPFPGDNITTVMYKIVHEDPPPAHTFEGKFPRNVDSVLSKALAKRPEARFKSCAELTEALRGLKEYPEIPEPVKAPREKTIRSPLPPVRKKKVSREILKEKAAYVPPREKSRRSLLFLLLAMMAVVMIFIVSVYIYFDKNKPADPQGGASPASVSTRPSTETYINTGNKHLESGRYEEALSAFQNALSSDPQNFEVQLSLAVALEKLERPDEAIEEYEKAVALNSADFRPYLSLGEIYDRSNNEEKAMSAYGRFLDLAPDSDNARRVRRRIEEIEDKLSAQNRPVEKSAIPAKVLPKEKAAPEEKKPPGKTPPAVESKQIKPQVQPPKLDFDRLFSNGIQALKQKEYQVCITQMETILKYDPDHSQARYYLAVAQKSMEEEERRKTEEERLAREIQNKLGMVERDLQAGKFQDSIDKAQEVLRLDPENSRAREYRNSATVKMAQGQIQSIVDTYIQSIKDKSLVSFYQIHCIPTLFQRIRNDTETTLKLYNDFQALASNVRTDVQTVGDNQYEARVSFNHILTGISQSSQNREVLFEGTISWIMEKRDDSWRIREIGYSTTGK